MTKEEAQHIIVATRNYILGTGRKFTHRDYGTAKSLIHYRQLLKRYVEAKKALRGFNDKRMG